MEINWPTVLYRAWLLVIAWMMFWPDKKKKKKTNKHIGSDFNDWLKEEGLDD